MENYTPLEYKVCYIPEIKGREILEERLKQKNVNYRFTENKMDPYDVETDNSIIEIKTRNFDENKLTNFYNSELFLELNKYNSLIREAKKLNKKPIYCCILEDYIYYFNLNDIDINTIKIQERWVYNFVNQSKWTNTKKKMILLNIRKEKFSKIKR